MTAAAEFPSFDIHYLISTVHLLFQLWAAMDHVSVGTLRVLY